MRFSLHKKEITETLISPMTGKQIEFSIRAYCPNCGCLISHSSVKTVEKALAKHEKCKKCNCVEVEVKYMAFETITETENI